MALYREGKAAMAADGTVTGTGTKWQSSLSLIRPGATIMFLSSPIQMAVVNKVVSDTEIKAITTNGAVVASTDYAILLSDSLTVDGLAQDVAETLRYYQSQETVIADAIEFFKNFDFDSLQNLANQIKADSEAAGASATAAAASETAAKTSETNSKASELAVEAAREQVQQIINDAGEQSTLVVLAQPDGYSKVGGLVERWQEEERQVIYAVNHGIIESGTVDSSDKLQNLIDSAGSAAIILPKIIGLKKTVKYRTNSCILGVPGSFTQVNMMSGFVGVSAFEPISKERNGAISPVIKYLTITDVTAVSVGAGTDSEKNGVDITGTFDADISDIKGVRIKNTVYSSPGTELQHTRRPKINALDGSNVDRHILLEGSGTGRFAYGDVFVSLFKTTGNCLKQSVIESADGLQVDCGVIFPNGGLRISGHYLTLTNVHLFEPKAELGSDEVPAGIHIKRMSPTSPSKNVTIAAVDIAFPGRLANTTIGNPTQVNNPGPGLLMEGVEDFNIQVNINNSSMQSAHLIDCSNGVLSLTSREANTQQLGSGALPPGTYDALLMEACADVHVMLVDNSASRKYAVNLDDNCKGCTVNGSVSKGYVIGQDVKIPNNQSNRVQLSIGNGASGLTRYQYDSTPPMPRYVSSEDGNTTPSVTGGVNNTVVKFQNGVVTNVTDLPDVTNSMEVTVNINDNNATRLVDVANGGKFKTRLGANIMGKGTYARFIRDAATGYLVQL